jgi:hypothetical protein
VSPRAVIPPHQAIETMREADVRWNAALAGVASFPDRLRTLSEAADEESRAMTLAHLANVDWKPRPGARRLAFPEEVRPGSDRPGPPKTWAEFDAAVEQFGLALEGDSMKKIANAFERISEVAAELADALEADTETEGHRQTG